MPLPKHIEVTPSLMTNISSSSTSHTPNHFNSTAEVLLVLSLELW